MKKYYVVNQISNNCFSGFVECDRIVMHRDCIFMYDTEDGIIAIFPAATTRVIRQDAKIG